VLVKRFAQLNRPQSEILPVEPTGERVVIEHANLEQIDEGVCFSDYLDCAIGIQHRLEANPRRDSSLVELADRLNPVCWQRSARLPLLRVLVGEQRHRRGECVPFSEYIEIAKGPASALRENLDVVPATVQHLDDLASKAMLFVKGLVRIGRKTEHHTLTVARIAPNVVAQFAHNVLARFRASVEVLTCCLGEFPRRYCWNVAIPASVSASTVMIDGQRGVLSGTPFRSIQN